MKIVGSFKFTNLCKHLDGFGFPTFYCILKIYFLVFFGGGLGVKHAVARVVANSSYIVLVNKFMAYDLDSRVNWD